jgi:hypothetical protein
VLSLLVVVLCGLPLRFLCAAIAKWLPVVTQHLGAAKVA